MTNYIIKHPLLEIYAGQDTPSGGYPFPTNNINVAFITRNYTEAKTLVDLCQNYDDTKGFCVFKLSIEYIPV